MNSLLTAIVRADGDALVMHVGERPYVVASSGPVELSSRPLTLEAVSGMLAHLLPSDARRALDELGAIEHELPLSAAGQGDRFTTVAARGGDDIWIEVRRHRRLRPIARPGAAAGPARPASGAKAAPGNGHAHEESAIQATARAAAESASAHVAASVGEAAVERRVVTVGEAAVEPPVPSVSEAAVEGPAPSVSEGAVEGPAPSVSEVAVEGPAPSVSEGAAEGPAPIVSEAAVEPASVEAAVEEPLPSVSEVAVEEPVVSVSEAAVEPPAPSVTEAPIEAAVPSSSEREVQEERQDHPQGVAAVDVPEVPECVGPAVDRRPEMSAGEVTVEPPVGKTSAEGRAASVGRPGVEGRVPGADAGVGQGREGGLGKGSTELPVRPLAASPIVERPGSRSYAFDAPRVSTRAVTPPLEAPPSLVLPLARHARTEPQERAVARPRQGGVERLLRKAVARGANAVYLMAEARPSIRVDGEILALEGEAVPGAEEMQRLLLDLAPERSRSAIESGEPVEWLSDVSDVGRVRCQCFCDQRGPGGVFQLIAARPTTAEQLGLSREVQALCAEPEGLLLVAGPRASGKSTVLHALVDLVNRWRNDYVITIESQLKCVHESRGALVSQREVRGSDADVAAMVRGALRENPDVLAIEDLRSPEVVHLALEAMEGGHLVIAGVSAPGATAAIAKLLEQYPADRRPQMQSTMAQGLCGVVSQVLLRKTAGGRVAARELLLNTPSVSSLIAEGRIAQLPVAIDNGRKLGMVPLNDALAAFVQNGAVDVKEAYRKAFERDAFLGVLRREGIDTSFVERF